jgi:flagellar basal-body rod protein FlgB
LRQGSTPRTTFPRRTSDDKLSRRRLRERRRLAVITPVGDTATWALLQALDGLDARQQAISANVANVETPGYLAREVQFEDQLRAALAAGDPSKAGVEVTQSTAPTRANGNNVNVDLEITANSENLLRQRLAVQALNAKYSLVRTAITGR